MSSIALIFDNNIFFFVFAGMTVASAIFFALALKAKSWSIKKEEHKFAFQSKEGYNFFTKELDSKTNFLQEKKPAEGKIEKSIENFEKVFQNWNHNNFMQFFIEIRPDLYRCLAEKASPHTLTSLEWKYLACAYMKMSNKDIANILSVELETVKSNKKRLKRKLNLNMEDRLENFIQDLSLSLAEK